jgi:quercetin dioxygenase-like cupin family protein
MSYPTPRYLGEHGDISAVFRPASTEPELISEPGQRIHYLATHASTKGEFGLYRVDMGPRSPGPSTHFHRTISESFFILFGTVELFNGERWIRAKEGDFLYVPAGGLHAFKNESDEPASMLLLFAPACRARSTSRESRRWRSVAARNSPSSLFAMTATSSTRGAGPTGPSSSASQDSWRMACQRPALDRVLDPPRQAIWHAVPHARPGYRRVLPRLASSG